MRWWPLTRSEAFGLPPGCRVLGDCCPAELIHHHLRVWSDRIGRLDLLLVLAATSTAEQDGISAAGATAASRRLTAVADAELLLDGPAVARRWPLPPLPAGVSPTLLSHAVLPWVPLNPSVVALGLPVEPDFPHLRFEGAAEGPANCVSTGHAMSADRVQRLWRQGKRLGRRLRRPLVLAECVPGGTTTAQAVLTALGLPVNGLISGSARQPPHALKRRLVAAGLDQAGLGPDPAAEAVVAAVGDPFQALTAGLLVGAADGSQPLLLAGGSQMAAVLALAMAASSEDGRQRLSERVMLGTTAWLAEEQSPSEDRPPLDRLIDALAARFRVGTVALSSGVRFHNSCHQQLRDYEHGYVKEGVGAGGLLLLAQLQGISPADLQGSCDRAMQALLEPPVTSGP